MFPIVYFEIWYWCHEKRCHWSYLTCIIWQNARKIKIIVRKKNKSWQFFLGTVRAHVLLITKNHKNMSIESQETHARNTEAHTHTEIDLKSWRIKLNFDYICTCPIDLTSNRIPSGAKIIRRVKLHSKLSLN